MQDGSQARQFLRGRRSHRGWCGWDAWDADRRGIGRVLPKDHRRCAANSCQGRRRAGCGQRWACRAECRQRQFRCWPRAADQPLEARCRPDEGRFGAQSCAAPAVREWAMGYESALCRGARVDALRRPAWVSQQRLKAPAPRRWRHRQEARLQLRRSQRFPHPGMRRQAQELPQLRRSHGHRELQPKRRRA
jgi:hypothetical protein